MNPNLLPLLGHTSQVGLLPSQLFKRGDIAKCLCWGAILQPNDKLGCFGPQGPWQSRLDLECIHAFHKMTIKGFSNTIMLRGVMGSKATFSALLGKKFGKSIPSVFPSMIRSKVFDCCTMLSLGPGCIRFVSIKCLILRLERGKLCKAGKVISKCNIVAPSAQTEDRRGAP
jgi:hypothetical protein